uniref:Prenyltransferase n=1 Tax=candidate division WOR-3 bacterium TaxID=2052148 RepID=A0A7V3VUT4_UNCW3
MKTLQSFNLFDYILLLRPLILIPVWNFYLIGNHLADTKAWFSIKSFLGLFIYTMLMGGIYILNQITDIETDRINKKLFILSENYIPLRNAYIEMFVLWGFSISLALFFGLPFFLIVVFSLLLGVSYSLPPIKLKGRPFLDALSNGFGYGILNFLAGWVILRNFEWDTITKLLPYFFSILAVFINTTIVDIEGDKKTGDNTTSVFIGAGASYILSTFLLLCGAILASLNKDLICLIPSTISLPLFFYVTLYYLKNKKINRRFTIVSFRLPGVIFTIITCLIYPGYIPFLILTIGGMKIYYKKRFNINYPSLSQG